VSLSDLLAVRGRDSCLEESFLDPESAKQRRLRAVQRGHIEATQSFRGSSKSNLES